MTAPLASSYLVPGVTFIALLVLAVGALVIVLLVIAVFRSAMVAVQEDLVVHSPSEVVCAEVDRRLAAVKGATVRLRAPGQPTVVLRETPGWTIIPVLVLFPVGLLALLIRRDVVLEVFTFDSPGGTVVRLTGRTRKPVLARVRTELAAIRSQVVGV